MLHERSDVRGDALKALHKQLRANRVCEKIAKSYHPQDNVQFRSLLTLYTIESVLTTLMQNDAMLILRFDAIVDFIAIGKVGEVHYWQ